MGHGRFTAYGLGQLSLTLGDTENHHHGNQRKRKLGFRRPMGLRALSYQGIPSRPPNSPPDSERGVTKGKFCKDFQLLCPGPLTHTPCLPWPPPPLLPSS